VTSLLLVYTSALAVDTSLADATVTPKATAAATTTICCTHNDDDDSVLGDSYYTVKCVRWVKRQQKETMM